MTDIIHDYPSIAKLTHFGETRPQSVEVAIKPERPKSPFAGLNVGSELVNQGGLAALLSSGQAALANSGLAGLGGLQRANNLAALMSGQSQGLAASNLYNK